jgi:D-alanyl-D-alanine carboxypeptidase
MGIRTGLLGLAIVLVHAGAGFAFEPVRTGASIGDLVLQVTSGKAVVAVPDARLIRASHSVRALPQRIQARHLASRRALPRVWGTAARGPMRISAITHVHKPGGVALASSRVPRLATRFSAVPPAVSARASFSLKRATTPISKVPHIRAKALYCLDCSSNKVVMEENQSEPLPIASITKLLTAMTVIDEIPLDKVVTVPDDIQQVPRHRVGIRPGDLFTVRDLLHGMLIESGNDCAEALARAYPDGGREGFMSAMKRKASRIGARSAELHSPSGLDEELIIGRKDGRDLKVRQYNRASAKDVALIARHAFRYPLIHAIATMKTYTMHTLNALPHTYTLATNDKLLLRKLPVAGAKTGFTNMAGKCIVALFKDEGKEHVVVVLNTPKHFKAAERIYRWATHTM